MRDSILHFLLLVYATQFAIDMQQALPQSKENKTSNAARSQLCRH